MSEKPQNEVVIDEEDLEDEEEERVKGEPSALSLLLNKYFHHLDRGGTLAGEILSGLIVFLLSICILFVNMQIVSTFVNGNVVIDSSLSDNNIAASMTYASMYLGSLIIAFIGSLLIGLLARLPFVQISLMGLGTSLIGLVSSSSGLSYYNLLFLSFIASIIYAIIMGVPVVKKAVFKAIPMGVRKALPSAIGLIVFVTCLQMAGLITTNSIIINPNGTILNSLTTYGINSSFTSKIATQAFFGMIIAFVFIAIFKALKVKRAYLYGFALGTVGFFVLNIISVGGVNPATDTANPDSILNFGRIWTIMGSSASAQTPLGDCYVTYAPSAFKEVLSNMGKVFTEGANFSAYTGNKIVLIINAVLTYLALGIADFDGTMIASESKLNESNKEGVEPLDLKEKDSYFAGIANAGINVIAPLFGGGAVRLSKTSIAGVEDEGKSGIVSVVASIGYLISMFIMVFPALLATGTYVVGSMNEFSYYSYGFGGFIYLTSSLTFGIADAVIAIVGLSMLKSLKLIDTTKKEELIPAILLLAISLATNNLVLGFAIACVAATIIKICAFRENSKVKFTESLPNFIPNFKQINIGELVCLGVMVIVLVFQMI